MTVKELIEALAKQPLEATVLMYDHALEGGGEAYRIHTHHNVGVASKAFYFANVDAWDTFCDSAEPVVVIESR